MICFVWICSSLVICAPPKYCEWKGRHISLLKPFYYHYLHQHQLSHAVLMTSLEIASRMSLHQVDAIFMWQFMWSCQTLAMEWGGSLSILGLKGQWSKELNSDKEKWFLDQKWFSLFIWSYHLHTQTWWWE